MCNHHFGLLLVPYLGQMYICPCLPMNTVTQQLCTNIYFPYPSIMCTIVTYSSLNIVSTISFCYLKCYSVLTDSFSVVSKYAKLIFFFLLIVVSPFNFFSFSFLNFFSEFFFTYYCCLFNIFKSFVYPYWFSLQKISI